MGEWILLIVTTLGAALLLLIVARYVIAIVALVDRFGSGKDSDLAKVGWGVRAIDKETSVIAAGVTELNAQLRSIRDGLQAIDGHLVVAVTSQE